MSVSQDHAPSITAVTSGQPHTHGPWSPAELGAPYVCPAFDLGSIVAMVMCCGEEEMEARKHLIAAAPDLLAALKALLAACEEADALGELHDAVDGSLIDDARAAISRAELGDQSACAASDAATPQCSSREAN